MDHLALGRTRQRPLLEHANPLWLVGHAERWNEMALRARRHVEQEFNARTAALRLASIYRELLGKRQ